MKRLVVLVASLPLMATAAEIGCSSMTVTLDETNAGAVRRIRSAAGIELGASRGQVPLFAVTATRTDDFKKSVTVEPDKKTTCAFERADGGLRLTYADMGEAVGKVVCTVRPDGAKLRWNISVEPKAGWAIEGTAYPRILTAERIGAASEDDAVVIGTAKGGVYRNPTKRAKGCHLAGLMPGSLVCQFGCHYDDSALFYYAAEDGRGYSKRLMAQAQSRGVEFKFVHLDFDERPFARAYDVVTAAIDGTRERPTVWQDAADLYRTWARQQSWCAMKPLRDREDLPRWMREAPAMVRFGREWLAEPDRIRTWMKDYWRKSFVRAPLVTAFWGWEKHGYWISDYYPVYPSDEAFAALVKDLRAMDAHSFPWPSGYYWILDAYKKADGTYEYTDYDAYRAAKGDTHACITRDGKPYRREPPWLRGGHSTCLCGGDAFTVDWWNRDVCLPLAKLGCELVQADQTVGGAFVACWSRAHGHRPGEGLWKRDAFYRQMKTMRETLRTVEPDSVVCFEEPCELYNDLVGIQDYRTCEATSDEWASVFNYVYHEWLPCFQSNPRRTDFVWKAHEAADGQIPHLTPTEADTAEARPALSNGDFENATKTADQPFAAWQRLGGYAGKVWRGRAFVDRETKHDGAAALRVECAADETHVQVSQNVGIDGKNLRIGGKYRLSAWLKTGQAKRPNAIGVCLLNGEKGAGGINQLDFPRPEDGWKRVTSDFTLKKKASDIRIMINAVPESVLWVDSMQLEEVLPDGKTKVVMRHPGGDGYEAFMRSWVALYHGRGRDWLAHGRQIRPPVLDCDTVPFSMTLYGGRKFEGCRPAIFHSAWESLDGKKALVFVNATREWQDAGYVWNGQRRRIALNPGEIKLVEK